MMGRWFKKALLYGAEALVALVLVLVFFLSCMWILELGFPKGAGLRELMGGSTWRESESADPSLAFGRSGGPRPASPKIIARLTDVRDRVKDKRSDRIAWGVSRTGVPLEERHAVQTFARSSAVIAFEGRGEVTLQANSLLVLGAAESGERAGRGDVSLIVTRGGVRGTVSGKRDDGAEFRVVTGSGEARFDAEARPTEFQVSVNPDRTSTFSVFTGSTEITSAGRTVKLSANQTVTVTPGAAPGEPSALPAQPEPVSPAADVLVPFRTVPPLLTYSWVTVPGATGYHVQLARDAGFKSPVDDAHVATASFAQGNLGPGDYFWRVSAMHGHAEGAASDPRRLTIIEDVAPPFLQVSFPEAPAEPSTIVVHGETEPGAAVFIGNARVATDGSGRFRQEVELAEGWNVVVVEAIDPAGNVAYQSQRLMTGAASKTRFQ